MKVLCLILARGGSQRIPNKNIKILGDKPLIAYTIECAKKSKYINRIIVSTDSNEIAKVSMEFGAEVPFRRPTEISQGNSTELEAFEHTLKWLKENEDYVPDFIVKLFPTSPFRKTESVDKAIELLMSNPDADSVRSVRLCSEHPHKMWTIDKENNRLRSFIPLNLKLPEAHTLSYQLLPEAYIQNASIDVVRSEVIVRKKSITGTEIIPFFMGEIESIDINTSLDFILAEAVIKENLVDMNSLNTIASPKIIPEDLESYVEYLDVYGNCLICESNEYELWAEYFSYKAVKCKKCGFIWINPSLNAVGLEKYYHDYIGMRFKDEEKTRQRQIQYQIDRDFLQMYISQGRVLDVGCSGGFFLNALNDAFEKHGVEIDREAVRYAQKNYSFGNNILHSSLLDASYPMEYFDLIVMRGSIEHLPDPRAFLKKVSYFLKKGGHFYVAATPNADSFCADLYREKWNQFHPIRHLFYFSPKTLSGLCLKEGLRLIAKDFPYPETPYADVEKDHLEVLQAIQLKKNNQYEQIKRSSAFWGNMMNLVFRKL